jgi:hypothetical protein
MHTVDLVSGWLTTVRRGGRMGSNWMVQIYEMSDEDAQRLVGALLDGIDGLTVELAVTGKDRFLIVDCGTAEQAIAVQRFVTAVDPRAVVIHTSTRHKEPVVIAVAG